MSDQPFRGAFPHQHGDPRTLTERIQAHLEERIREAIEMAALELLVERHRLLNRPAPTTANDADRKEFEQTTADFLTHLSGAFARDLPPEARAPSPPPAAEGRDPRLAEQVALAGRLPDYWQRLDRYRGDYLQARLAMPAPDTGWLARIFRGRRDLDDRP